MGADAGGAFRALANRNYRLWSIGSLISNLGAWMQRVAQDWLILVELTRHDATAVGIVTACQFGPQVLLLPWTGAAADRADRKKLLFLTQAVIGLLAVGLALLTIGGWVRVWHVYAFALGLGCATAFDAPVRQAFVSDMVGEADVANAIALNATVMNGSRLIGPALAGVLIAAVGSGWVFAINAASYGAVLLSLLLMRTADLRAPLHPAGASGGFAEGIAYIRERREIMILLGMLFVFGTFGLNFPIFISTMAASVYHLDASGFGLLTSAMAVGSFTGAIVAARQAQPEIRRIIGGALLFGGSYAVAAIMPDHLLFGLALMFVGIASQTVTTSVTSRVQLATEPRMRGRVMSVLITVALGGQPLGAPMAGWIANEVGPRYAVAMGAAAGFLTALIGWLCLLRRRETGTGGPA
ncbi:MFS transporter [Sphingobium sp.]|uniref:MFS transporter n=1 Tax=Sphingobium sp. TaxID=1912891 RepID=UPI003B3A5910